LKKHFGEDVTAGRGQEEGNVGLVEISPPHLTYLLERCSLFMNMDTAAATPQLLTTPKEQQETLDFFVRGIQSVLELTTAEASQVRAKTVPHLLETFERVYQVSWKF